MAASFGKMPTNVGPALDLGVQAFERVRAVNLQPMRLGEAQAREHVGLRVIHGRADLREAFAQLIGDRTPLPEFLCDRSRLIVRSSRIDRRT